MSALGQKQTSVHVCVMSALPPKADVDGRERNGLFRANSQDSSARLSFRPIDPWLSGLILERKAIHVASLELLASNLSGFFVEPGKTGAI